jgi:glycosyltransferase involved in cell wall biosynthesis
MKLSIVIPVFNEALTITSVMERVLSVDLDKEIVLIDDGSSDGTAEIVDKHTSPTIKVIHQRIRQGKGAAIRAGIDHAQGDIIVIQDADLEYDPRDFLKLIDPIAEGRADVVYGVRLLDSQKMIMKWGNKFLTWVTNRIYGQHLKDMETCYKMMKREVAQNLNLECSGFDIEAEITAKLLRAGHTIYEVPISYTARYENKKLSPFDGLPTLRALWKYRQWNPPAKIKKNME